MSCNLLHRMHHCALWQVCNRNFTDFIGKVFVWQCAMNSYEHWTCFKYAERKQGNRGAHIANAITINTRYVYYIHECNGFSGLFDKSSKNFNERWRLYMVIYVCHLASSFSDYLPKYENATFVMLPNSWNMHASVVRWASDVVVSSLPISVYSNIVPHM